MFEKTALTTAKTIYWLTIGSGAAWLAWVCFAHLPFWVALFLFPFALALAALAGAPLAAGASFVGGLLVALVMLIGRKATASSRSGA
ncbi:hypothetical protein LH427_04690 [Laribacter hongkongensis]|uniref:hypothetical protein n=1 Tax=Laribacter hongkongensis TaxID=168471 RepID=UPI001EFC8956|nr:hypothetical protein [Laribacter hongkongensis]MCG8991443.1 hypothetical protein [Laribacter hongkongensis]MCG8997699.1 hypothetical protein [Laribacter hongkongensis]MCG9001275.1 hypothetical protein [Laribacter hongkongensis]MCG9004611.1 hypothetical protein [Laribacter hongkongensis]MCG9007483.1 hypothetical protein [Laribacter hongkongensis]